MLSDKIEKIALSGTMEISAKLLELRNKGIIAYDLCVGEPDLPTPDHIKAAAKMAIDENKTKYTINSGIQELKEAISSKFLREYGSKYDLREIIVTNGAKQAVYNVLQTIISDGDEVLIPSPYYVSYPHMVRLAGGIPKFVETDLSDSFQIKSELLNKSASDRTRAMILCNPCNPTGVVYNRNQLGELIQFSKEKNLFILVDEIYEKLIYDSETFTSLASLAKDYRENIIIVNGVSKAYSMTGWRIGYALARNDIISGMNKLQSHSTSHPCTISQYASVEALNSNHGFVEKQRSIFEERRNLVYEMLSEIDDIEFRKPMGAFYFFIGMDGGGSKTKCILCDESLNIKCEFQSGPSNFLSIGTDVVSKTVLNLISKSCKNQNIDVSKIKNIVLGTTGAGRESDAENLKNAILQTAESMGININLISVVSDARIALEGALSGNPGSILIAGTGSIMFGKDKNGIIHRVGGFGRLLGDEGSGLTIGRMGLNVVAKTFDGRISSSLLKDKVESKFKILDQNQLIIKVYNEDFPIQDITPLVIQAAAEGDRHCIDILDRQSDELILHILAMKEKLKEDHLNLVFIGGTITNENKYSQMLRDKINTLLPTITLQEPEFPPEIGAAIMAKASL